MDLSSETDSFVWTDASSSDSIEDTMVVNKKKNNIDKKQYIQKDTSSNENDERNLHTESHDNGFIAKVKKEVTNLKSVSKKKGKIKQEPESDIDIPKKKKKNKYDDTKVATSDDDDGNYLHMKVKEEKSSVDLKLKNKSRKHSEVHLTSSLGVNGINIENNKVLLSPDVSESNDINLPKPKKKKKKSKKNLSSDDDLSDNIVIEDKFTAEDTIVQSQKEQSQAEVAIKSPIEIHSISFPGNNMSFEDTADSSCDEISVIKGDDDHNLNTTLFIDKNIEEGFINKRNNSGSENSNNKNASQKVEVNRQRIQKISDRIKFEDEDDLSDVHGHKVKAQSMKSSKLNHYIKANVDLKPFSQNLSNHSYLTKHDEVWLLKCPKDVNVNAFKNVNLNLDGKRKVKISGESYETSYIEKGENVPVLTIDHNKLRIKNLPLSGVINLRKKIPKLQFQEDNIMINNQTNFIPLPETKCRHPLFGSNFKRVLKIPSSVAQRLSAFQSREQVSAISEPRKKKHKKNKIASMDTDTETYTEIKLKSELELPAEITVRKKKKRKHDDINDSYTPRKKRIKYDPESAEAWDSEKAIEENLFSF